MTAIVVEGMTKRYGAVTAVDDISFEVGTGEVLALLGPNGAGKTTSIEILEGFQAPSSGVVRVLDTDPRHGNRAWRARIGLVLQSTSLDLTLTVAEVLTAYATVYPRAMSVADVLEVTDLVEEANTRIAALSGGQRRRVDLGLGIIGRPELLFLDEPTTGLDPQARRRVWSAVRTLTDAGATVVLTTHYLEEADHLADRVVVLAEGRVVADATPAGLRTRTATSVIRTPLPANAALPARLAAYLNDDELVLPSTDVAGDLTELLDWSRHHAVDLGALQVAPPSLEEAYLALTTQDVLSHG